MLKKLCGIAELQSCGNFIVELGINYQGAKVKINREAIAKKKLYFF